MGETGNVTFGGVSVEDAAVALDDAADGRKGFELFDIKRY